MVHFRSHKRRTPHGQNQVLTRARTEQAFIGPFAHLHSKPSGSLMWKLPGVSRTSNPASARLRPLSNLLVRVPVGHRVGDVIDARRVEGRLSRSER